MGGALPVAAADSRGRVWGGNPAMALAHALGAPLLALHRPVFRLLLTMQGDAAPPHNASELDQLPETYEPVALLARAKRGERRNATIAEAVEVNVYRDVVLSPLSPRDTAQARARFNRTPGGFHILRSQPPSSSSSASSQIIDKQFARAVVLQVREPRTHCVAVEMPRS